MLHSIGHSVWSWVMGGWFGCWVGGWLAGEVENIAISSLNQVEVEVEDELGNKCGSF